MRVGLATVLLTIGITQGACSRGAPSPRVDAGRSGDDAGRGSAAGEGGADSGSHAPPPVESPRAPEPLAEDPIGDAACRSTQSVAIFHSPRRPTVDGVLRVIAVAERPLDAVLVARGPDGRVVRLVADSRGGPPWSWLGTLPTPAEGTWRVALLVEGEAAACRRVRVRRSSGGLGGSNEIWRAEGGWSRSTENLYSAWIERLFDAPPDRRVQWSSLSDVTRDPGRNFLWNHMGLREDEAANPGALVLDADCADTPYFLRAYFAWKMRLPFQYSACEVPEGERSPRCHDPVTNEAPREKPLELDSMNLFLRRLADTVHSGSLRTLPDDDQTDAYPVTLSRESMRPGTIYADPHGHVLVITSWQPPRDGASGVLWAVDGNPDRRVRRKRFWRGTFAFLRGTWSGAPGFRAFRPIVVKDGVLAALTNAEIRGTRAYGNYSGEQHGLRPDAFYERIERLVTPSPVDATRAFDETLDAFHDLLRDRADIVAAGEAFMRENGERVIAMPPGAEIFATQAGPWEDYSTPSRDLQLLVAMDVVQRLPDVVERNPDRFLLPDGRTAEEVAENLRGRLAEETRSRSIAYVRTDGSRSRLTLAEVISRAPAFETAYNPNDCVETRWGAPEGSPEHSTCARHAPPGQIRRMRLYAQWFARRERPPRTP